MNDRIDDQRIRRLNAPDAETQTTEWLNVSANNYGFFSKFDYPYRAPSDKEFLVGVFGGSVAQWFCLQQGRAFARELSVSLDGHQTVEILNFGLGGFKQPQSMLAFSYFLMLGQHFDSVLLLDGFNEAALSWINATRGTACALPSIAYADMFRDSVPLYELKTPEPGLSVRERVKEIASIWEEGARIMREICHERRIPFFHILQPNQYYSGKAFGEEERDIAISDTSPYRIGVMSVYPELANRMQRIAGADCNAFDATGIFDDHTEIVYSDNCCHYNRRGNEIMGKFILRGMSQKEAGRNRHGQSFGLQSRGIRGRMRDWFVASKPAVRQRPKGAPEGENRAPDDLYPMW